LVFDKASEARSARNSRVHPVVPDILSHYAWKELEEKVTDYVDILQRGDMLTQEEWQEYKEYWNSCACCRVFDQPTEECCSPLKPYPCYHCELERRQEEARDNLPKEFL